MILKIDGVTHSSLSALVTLVGDEKNQIGGYGSSFIKEVKSSRDSGGFDVVVQIDEFPGQPGDRWVTPLKYLLELIEALKIFPDLEKPVKYNDYVCM